MKIKKILYTVIGAVMSSLIIFSGCNSNTPQNSTLSQSSVQNQSSEPSETSGKQEVSVNEESSNQTSEQENSSDGEQITPTMWKVTSADGNKNIYMMGSIHVADKSVENMPDYFEEIYSICDALAVEVDISELMNDLSSSLSVSMLTDMMYLDGTTIKDHISEDTYNKAVELLKENNMYSIVYDYCIPIYWSSLIESIIYENSGLDANYGVDTTLINRAKKDGKEVLEIESAELQTELLTGFSDEVQEMILESYVADGAIEAQEKALNDLYGKWKSGTITADDVLNDQDETGMTEEELRMVEEYNTAMLDDRNTGMADKAEEYMNSDDTVLFVVGTAHFYGDNGILQLMKDRGYTVTRITSADMVSDMAQAA